MRNIHFQRRARQAGVSLIEVLVSVLVVSIGMFGAAALQSTALRNNQGSYERTQVNVAANSMLDAMRSNVAGVTAGSYQMADWTCSAPSSGTLAQTQLNQWITDLQAQVNSSACGRIDCTARQCTVGVRWDDSRASGGSDAQTVEITGRL